MKNIWYQQVIPIGLKEFNENQYEHLVLRKESARGAVVKDKTIYIRMNDNKDTKFISYSDVGFGLFNKLWDFPDGSRIEIAMRKVED